MTATPARTDATHTLDSAAIALPPPLALEREDGRQVPLPPRSTLELGSDPACALHIDDPYASRRHARVVPRARGPLIEDLGSKNGTHLDGVRVERGYLRAGMCLRIGHSRLLVVRADVHGGRRAAEAAGPSPTELGLVGESAALRRALRLLPRVASLSQPVLIRGETGTGKELAARALHRLGRPASAPFVAINCGAVADQLAESELFGHAKGAFTGATRAREGAFVRAGGGTLFLDEVGELSAGLQAALLRVLETRRCLPVGGEHERQVSARVVAATHRDLETMVNEGLFREDLYHRLAVFCVELPPLRERSEDIPRLIERFAGESARELGREVRITEGAISAAGRHPWPGNVRQLRNAVARAAALCDGAIGAEALLPTGGPTRCHGASAIEVPRGNYRSMNRALLEQVVREAGSLRKAAALLDVPRTTLAGWLRR